MRTTDNNRGCITDPADLAGLGPIANRPVEDLLAENPALLLFPERAGAHGDQLGDDCIFDLVGDRLTTYNVMGFLGAGDARLTIASRFQPGTGSRDYFLYYLLETVFALNLFDLPMETGDEDIWDIFLICLFPFYLNRALNQGLYKEYRRQQHNDPNIRGRIDIARHLRQNLPFLGNIAYQTREHDYDNRITQLVRHTIAHIQKRQLSATLVGARPETRRAMNQVMQATPAFQPRDVMQVMALTRRPVSHPFYTAWEPLRKLCLRILRNEGLGYGTAKDQVFGLLFDGAWLWEEYLGRLLLPLGFLHPRNKLGAKDGEPVYLFENDRGARYPDFYHPRRGLVLDAKYKRLEDKNGSAFTREDLHQLVTYLHVLKAHTGCFIYPAFKQGEQKLGVLKGYGGSLNSYGLAIPAGISSFREFTAAMAAQELDLLAFLGRLAPD